MSKQNLTKLVLVCEECGCETTQLEIRKHLMYCKECAEAKKRRERFLREEKEWNEK
jgi:hypothetical protein